MKVAVLKGGRSLERGVSLRSGARVEDALARLGHEVVALDVGGDLVKRLSAERPDVAFVAMHGVGGEDGTAQELLEILGIPFTGPGAAACARCMDKSQSKPAIREAGLPTPDWFAFSQTAFRELGAADALRRLEESLGFPLVVKPSRGGSSLGVKFAAGGGRGPAGPGLRLQLRRPRAARALRRGARAGGQRARRRGAAGGGGDSRARATPTTSKPATRSAAPASSAPPSWVRESGTRWSRRRSPPTAPSAAPASPAST